MQTININILRRYPNHPFSLYEGKRLHDMKESIRENGILSPILVRPSKKEAGCYEIISGHNRVKAAGELGMEEVPSIIKEGLTDDEAAFLVTETNLIQRSFADLSHSERALLLKNHLDAEKKLTKMGRKPKALLELTDENMSAPMGPTLWARGRLAEKYGLARETVRRYVRIAHLPRLLLNRVDVGDLKTRPAVEISYLSPSELEHLSAIWQQNKKMRISIDKACQLREASKSAKGTLTREDITAILHEKPRRLAPLKICLSDEVINKLAGYRIESEDVLNGMLLYYITMLEQGMIKDVFGLLANEKELTG